MHAEITIGHTVDEILKDLTHGGNDESAVATGTINGGELSDQGAAELAPEIQKHMVAVDPNAPSCCIDGRPCVRTLAGAPTAPRPSVSGGALTTAYAAAELTNWFGSNDSEDTAARRGCVNQLLRANGIVPGAHCDELAVENHFENPDTKTYETGCGAGDKLKQIIQKVYENKAATVKLLKPLMGTGYNENYTRFEGETAFQNKTKQWDPRYIIDAVGDSTAIEVLASKYGEPNHGHREVAVLFNYQENTTLDRDAFTRETGEQIFTVDMWYIDNLAKALAEAGGKTSVEYERLKHAMVAYQVGTYLVLCDGSQRIMITSPRTPLYK